MTEEEIKAVFDKVYNGMKNPVFKYPVYYTDKGEYIFEVAAADTQFDVDMYRIDAWKDFFKGLFCTDKMWVSVLEEKNGEYIKRHDLNGPISSIEEFNAFVENIVNKRKG